MSAGPHWALVTHQGLSTAGAAGVQHCAGPGSASHPRYCGFDLFVFVLALFQQNPQTRPHWRQNFPMTTPSCRGRWETPGLSSGSVSYPPESRTPRPVNHPGTRTARGNPPRDPHSLGTHPGTRTAQDVAPALQFPCCEECWAHGLFARGPWDGSALMRAGGRESSRLAVLTSQAAWTSHLSGEKDPN